MRFITNFLNLIINTAIGEVRSSCLVEFYRQSIFNIDKNKIVS